MMPKDYDYLLSAKEYLSMGRENDLLNARYYSAVDRLFLHEGSVQAWRKLYSVELIKTQPSKTDSKEDRKSLVWWNKRSKNEAWIYTVDSMRSILKYSLIDESKKHTSSEIKSAANEASEKAKDLANLINRHSTLLDISLYKCLSEVESHAMETASEYICNDYINDKRSFSSFKWNHYRSLRYQLLSQDLRDILWRFSHFARETKDITPVKPKPRTQELEARLFSEELCSCFKNTYGKPLTPIVTSFVSAVFDDIYSNDTVKDWWNRHKNRG